jgi:tetratricopeptide (TPR) repeat protein
MWRAHVTALVLVAAALAAASPLAADQTDPRLDPLFRELETTDSALAAGAAEREIWAIWMEVDDAAARRALAEGVRLMQRARLRAAEAAFSRAIAAAPDVAEAWNKRATVRYLQGDDPGSVRDIRRTLALEPRHFGALSGLGMIYERSGEPKRALDAYAAALAINPHLDAVRRRLAELRRALEGAPI